MSTLVGCGDCDVACVNRKRRRIHSYISRRCSADLPVLTLGIPTDPTAEAWLPSVKRSVNSTYPQMAYFCGSRATTNSKAVMGSASETGTPPPVSGQRVGARIRGKLR
ncbi:hypothetical protein B296_00022704 [Ensete ventricosum]|uniref:Uncharacterized protein n=1 Tax=Ensete ventricosum TaxID=4639 RepID=A0A426Z7S5_ENSVE|nr:hypothetical protein B296_00022704 [Ensete ventricosum]